MRKLLFTLFIFLSFSAQSQTDYYTGKDTVRTGDEDYKITFTIGEFEFTNTRSTDLLNKDTRYDGKLKDGTRVKDSELHYQVSKTNNNKGLYRAAREVFTSDEIAKLANSPRGLALAIYIRPDGSICDMSLYIPTYPQYLGIPPYKWAKLIDKIKEYHRIYPIDVNQYLYVTALGFLNFRNVYKE